jgi:hypothetical protein
MFVELLFSIQTSYEMVSSFSSFLECCRSIDTDSTKALASDTHVTGQRLHPDRLTRRENKRKTSFNVVVVVSFFLSTGICRLYPNRVLVVRDSMRQTNHTTTRESSTLDVIQARTTKNEKKRK